MVRVHFPEPFRRQALSYDYKDAPKRSKNNTGFNESWLREGRILNEQCNLDPESDEFTVYLQPYGTVHPNSGLMNKVKTLWHNCLILDEHGEFIGRYPVIRDDYICLKCNRDFSCYKDYIDSICLIHEFTL